VYKYDDAVLSTAKHRENGHAVKIMPNTQPWKGKITEVGFTPSSDDPRFNSDAADRHSWVYGGWHITPKLFFIVSLNLQGRISPTACLTKQSVSCSIMGILSIIANTHLQCSFLYQPCPIYPKNKPSKT
jgi:hypothetical protein